MSQRLIRHIAALDPFKNLDEATLEGLEDELAWVHLAPGEVLLRQGDPPDALYTLIRGRLRVVIRNPDGSETAVDELDPGVSVGDMELLTGRKCVATVAALEETELVRLSKAGFERLAEGHPQAIGEFAQTLRPRFQRAQLSAILSALFGELETKAVHDLQSHLEWVHLRSGEVLLRQSDPGDAMYVIVQGRLRLVVEGPDGGEMMVGEVSSGDSIGEFALVTGEARTATVYAVRDTDMVRLSQPLFDDLLARYPQMIKRIAQIVIQREQRLMRAPSGESTTAMAFALVPAGTDVPLSAFGQRLADTLATFGPTLYLDAERFDSAYGKAGMSQTAEDHPTNLVLMAWLAEREREVRYIVYEADRTWSPWTQRCLRQADCVYLVGRAGSDPTPGDIECEVQRAAVSARTELVLLQPGGTDRPFGTSSWLKPRRVDAYHHVRGDLQSQEAARDLERLAHRATGRALGLVLSGGGARGFGHVGAIRALEEAGLHVDLVGGTSMGALVGGAYALGYDYRGMVELAEQFASPKGLFDYTLPLVSFFETKKVTHMLVAMAQDARMEDLWLPFFCVSCSLSAGQEVVHREGKVWECIRASLAIPGVFAPVLQDGDLLVDGGAMNNLPIDVMRDLCPGGTVIGIDASPAQDKGESYDFGPSVSGWQVLWSRVNPFIPRMQVPSILGSLVSATLVNSRYRVAATRHLADLVVPLPVEAYGTLDFGCYQEIIELGYNATRQALEGWRPAHSGGT